MKILANARASVAQQQKIASAEKVHAALAIHTEVEIQRIFFLNLNFLNIHIRLPNGVQTRV